MSLSSRLAVGVSDRARRRGLDYFRQGRARVAQSDGESVEYVVRGTRHYAVTLSIEHDVLYCACTCPSFLDREEACKHIWAAILDCERGRVLAAGARVLTLEPDPVPRQNVIRVGTERFAHGVVRRRLSVAVRARPPSRCAIGNRTGD